MAATVIITVLERIRRTRTSSANIRGARLLKTFTTCCTATKSVVTARTKRAIRVAGNVCRIVCKALREPTSQVAAYRLCTTPTTYHSATYQGVASQSRHASSESLLKIRPNCRSVQLGGFCPPRNMVEPYHGSSARRKFLTQGPHNGGRWPFPEVIQGSEARLPIDGLSWLSPSDCSRALSRSTVFRPWIG